MILAYGLGSSIYLYAFSGLINIYKARNSKHFKDIFQWKYFASQVFFYFFALYTFLMMTAYSTCDIWNYQQRSVFMLFGGQCIYVVMKLQYSKIIDQQVNPFRRSILLIWILVWVNVASIIKTGTPLMDEIYLLYGCVGL